MRQMLYRALFHPEEVHHFLPLKDVPHFQFPGVREIWKTRMLHQIPAGETAEDLFWRYHKINVPAFHVGGCMTFSILVYLRTF